MAATIVASDLSCRVTVSCPDRPADYTFTVAGGNIWSLDQLAATLRQREKAGVKSMPVRFKKVVDGRVSLGNVATLPIAEILVDCDIDPKPAAVKPAGAGVKVSAS